MRGWCSHWTNGQMSCLTQPTASAEEVHMTQQPSVFPARGEWLGRMDSTAGGGHSKLKPWAAQKSEVMVEDSGQTCRVTRPGEDQSLHTLTNMAMQADIPQYIAHPVEHQAVTVPGPQPQRGPPVATSKANQEEKRRQQAKSLSSHPETSAVLLVFVQWNTEGLQKKKPELQIFLKRKGGDIICIQETHQTDAHHFTLRGYELSNHDRADQHKGGIVTLVWNTIPAVEVGRSGRDSEHLAIRVVLQGSEITVINYYFPPHKDLQLHTLPLVNHSLLTTSDFNGHSPN